MLICEGCGKQYAQPGKYKTIETRGPLKLYRKTGLYNSNFIDIYTLCMKCFEQVEDAIEGMVRGGSLTPRVGGF